MKNRLISLLRWSEQYTKTDMVYLASGTFWSNFNMAIVTLLSFAGSILFARYMSKDAYGTYQYILAIAGLIGATTLNNMNSAVTRAVARGFEGEFKHSVHFQLMAGIIPAVLGLSVSSWYFIHSNYTLGSAFVLIALFLPLGNAFNTWVAYLGGKKMFRIGTYYGLFNNIISYVPILLALYFTRNVLWIVAANYFFIFLTNFILYLYVIKHIPPNEKRDNETISYGIHLSVMNIFGTLAGQLDSLLVFHFIGSTALAIYSFATIIPEKISGILKFIPNLVLLRLSDRSEEQVKDILKKKLWVIVVLVVVSEGSYAAFAPWAFHTFFPAYVDSIHYTQIYALSFFSLVTTVVQMALIAQRKTKELYIVSFVMPTLRILLLSVLLYFYGIWGLLWAQILLNFILFGLQIIIFIRKKPLEATTVTPVNPI